MTIGTKMADTVKIGNVNIPKPALIIGVAASAGVLFYAYYMRSAGGTTDEPAATTDDGIDPYTGLPYTDEYGYNNGGYTPPVQPDWWQGQTGNNIVTGNTTNAMWTQSVINYFQTSGTYADDNVAGALGKVLTGQKITTDELNIFNAARAVQGEPPQGYPPIQMVSAAPPGTTNPTAIGPPSLRVSNAYRTSARIEWNHVPGAQGYTLYVNGARRTSVVYSVYTFQALKPGKRYTIKVTPIGGRGVPVKSSSITVTTKK